MNEKLQEHSSYSSYSRRILTESVPGLAKKRRKFDVFNENYNCIPFNMTNFLLNFSLKLREKNNFILIWGTYSLFHRIMNNDRREFYDEFFVEYNESFNDKHLMITIN